MRKRSWKSVRATNLHEAMELSVEFATENRKPPKVLADLMGVDTKTLYRWLSEDSMPLNRVRQFETFCGTALISDYLFLAHGDKVVIAIPAGKKSGVTELAEVQCAFAEAMALLFRFYQGGDKLDETVAALTGTLTQLAYQRSNVLKTGAPELDLFGAEK